MHVSAVLPAHFNMEELYLSEPTGPPSLLRVRRPDFKTFLLAHDTSLVVGVLGTHRANSGKSSFHTCLGSWGLSQQGQLVQVCPFHARLSL